MCGHPKYLIQVHLSALISAIHWNLQWKEKVRKEVANEKENENDGAQSQWRPKCQSLTIFRSHEVNATDYALHHNGEMRRGREVQRDACDGWVWAWRARTIVCFVVARIRSRRLRSCPSCTRCVCCDFLHWYKFESEWLRLLATYS